MKDEFEFFLRVSVRIVGGIVLSVALLSTSGVGAQQKGVKDEIRFSVLKDLKNPDGETRAAAVRVLGRLGAVGQAPRILALLNDPSETVQAAAAGFFAEHPSPTAIPKLWACWQAVLPGVNSSDADVRLPLALMKALAAHKSVPALARIRPRFVVDLRGLADKKASDPRNSVAQAAAVFLVKLGEAKAADYGVSDFELYSFEKSVAETRPCPEIETVADALDRFQKNDEELAASDSEDTDKTRRTIESWFCALERLGKPGSRTAVPSLLAWLERVERETGEKEPHKLRLADRRWRAVCNTLKVIAVRENATMLLDSWKRMAIPSRAYDLAWLVAEKGAFEELTAQASNSEPWRREQIGLILYGHADGLTLDQAATVLKVKQLCRFQQLWLLTSVVKKTHPSDEDLSAFLERNKIEATPELLYELRRSKSAWVVDQIKRILAGTSSEDTTRLLAWLPDFAFSERADLLERALSSSSGNIRATALEALHKVDPEKASAWATAHRSGETDARVFRVVAAVLGSTASDNLRDRLEAISKTLFSVQEAEAFAAWIDDLGEARDMRIGPALVTILRTSPNATFRSAAARALGKIGESERIDALRLALTDSDKEVRRAAIEALGQVGASDDFDRLKPFLFDIDLSNTTAAAMARLLKFKPPPIPDAANLRLAELVAALPWSALHAANPSEYFYALRLCGDKTIVPQIIAGAFQVRVFGSDEQEAAAAALASLDRTQSLRLLQAMLAATDDDAKVKAVLLLMRRPLRDMSSVESLANLLTSESASVQQAGVLALGVLRDRRATPSLLKLLERPDLDPEARDLVLEALLVIDPEKVLLGDMPVFAGSPRAMIQAIYTLCRITGPKQRQARRQLLKMYLGFDDDQIGERGLAAAGLVMLGDGDAVGDLVKLSEEFNTGESEGTLIAAAALYPLGNLPDGGESRFRPYLNSHRNRGAKLMAGLRLALGGDAQATQGLLNALASDAERNELDEFLAAFEILTLGTTSAPGVAETLLNVLNQGEIRADYNFMSGAAVLALGDLGDKRALPALRRARLSIDPLIAFYATGAMYKLADEAWALDLLSSRHPQLVKAGIFIGERFPSPAMTNALVSALSHSDWRVRGQAAFALGRMLPRIGTSAAAEAALTETTLKDPSRRVRDEAAAALEHIRHPETFAQTYFEAGPLLDWGGTARTGFDDFLNLKTAIAKIRSESGGETPSLTKVLRSIARGEIQVNETYNDSVNEILLFQFIEPALALHLLGEARTHDAFALTRAWATDNALAGTIFEEAGHGASGILLGETGNPEAINLLSRRRDAAREWLVRALLNIGIRKLKRWEGMQGQVP